MLPGPCVWMGFRSGFIRAHPCRVNRATPGCSRRPCWTASDSLYAFERHYDRLRACLQKRAGLEIGEELAAQTFEVAFASREG